MPEIDKAFLKRVAEVVRQTVSTEVKSLTDRIVDLEHKLEITQIKGKYGYEHNSQGLKIMWTLLGFVVAAILSAFAAKALV